MAKRTYGKYQDKSPTEKLARDEKQGPAKSGIESKRDACASATQLDNRSTEIPNGSDMGRN